MKTSMSYLLLAGPAMALTLGTQCPTTMTNGGGQAMMFTATLSGDAANPPVTTNGMGTGSFTLSADETQLTFDITASGLSGPVIAAHFHFSPTGPAGSGGIVFGITAMVSEANGQVTANGSWALSATDVTNLKAGNLYVNFHTAENPNGEIRGNLVAAM